MNQHLNDLSRKEEIRAKANCYQGNIIENKEKVLEFFASNKPMLFTTMKVIDRITDTEVEYLCNSRYYDELYFWSESDIYHFKKYNMPLKQSFIEYAISKTK